VVSPARCDWQMNDAIASWYVIAKHIIAIDTHHELRPCTVSTVHTLVAKITPTNIITLT